MMLRRKKPSILSLFLTVVLATTPKLLDVVLAQPVRAQSPAPTSFPLPSSVPNGTTIRVDGSESMVAVNQQLKQRFEAQYTGTTVDLANQGTDAALQALLSGTIDLAAIGRSLTDEERGQGLVEVPISREKIAIIVGADNPFQENLTFEQFARIFRGEITDWSEIGGSSGPIRLVDRPDSSDTRKTLSAYSVFQVAPFATGATATQSPAEETEAIVNQLGRDGISYAIAGQVLNRSDVRIIPMHGTLPDDPRYPYSQPRNYVYKDVSNPGVQAFLGYVASPEGQQSILAAEPASAAGSASAALSSNPVSPSAEASPTEASPTEPLPSSATELSQAAPGSSDSNGSAPTTANQGTGTDANPGGWLPWLLLPLVGGGLLLWGLKRRGDRPTPDELAPSTPPATPPEPKLAERMGSVIAADRSSLPERGPTATELPGAEDAAMVESPELPQIPQSEDSPSTFTPPLGAVGGIVAAGVGAAGVGVAAMGGLAGLGRDRRSRIILTPRTIDQGYAYWESPEAEKAALKQQGGEKLTLRIADVTGLEATEVPHSLQSYDCEETDCDRFVALPQPDRDYVAEIGYLTEDGSWLSLARSAPVHVAAGSLPAVVEATAPVAEATMTQDVVTEVQEEATEVQEIITSIQDEAESPSLTNIAMVGGAALAAGASLLPDSGSSASTAEGESAGEIPLESTIDLEETNLVQDTSTLIQEGSTEVQASVTEIQELGVDQEDPMLGQADLTVVQAEVTEVQEEATEVPDEADPPSLTNIAMVGGAALAAGASLLPDSESSESTGEGESAGEMPPELTSELAVSELAESTTTAETDFALEEIATGDDDTLLIYGTIDEPFDVPAPLVEGLVEEEIAVDVSSSLEETVDPETIPEFSGDEAIEEVVTSRSEPSDVAPEADRPPGEIPSGPPVNLAIAGGAVLAVGAAMTSEPTEREKAQTEVEAAKFDLGQADLSSEALASVDEGLSDLADGYGDSWITLLPRDPQWAYAYWDIPDQHRQALRQQGGQRLALRFYDVTAIDLSHQNPHSLEQYECDELARDWYIPVPVSDRDYIVEIGYVADDGRWLMLARSNAIRIPPIHPANWYEEQFITVDWDEDLGGKTFLELSPPGQQKAFGNPLYDRIFELVESAESQRVAGSLFGSMQQVPPESVSSFALGSGAGLAARTESGVGMSGVGMSGVGMYSQSGAGMSGIGMSGVGMYSQSGVGMSGVGMYSQFGAGMYSQSGMGMMSGIGMVGQVGVAGMSGVGMSGVGMSGMGLLGVAGMSGVGMSGIGMYNQSGVGMMGMSGIGMYSQSGAGMMNMSGVGWYGQSGMGMMGMSGIGMYSQSGMGMMSGIGLMSGVGFSASMPPIRSRKFWLIADAELIIYGATEPDATVTIAGRPVQLNPDGTFRFQMSFQDGLIDFPILAVAADGEQSRSIHMTFTRETPSRNTNTPDEAQDEFF